MSELPTAIPPDIYNALKSGPSHSFRDVLHESLPLASIGVYTIWRGSEFVYVGIAGRNLDLTLENKRMRGVRDRLDSPRSGRRSGDQFAVYVCDRLVLPTLTLEQIKCVGAGELSLDALTRAYIREHLFYRFAATDSYAEAFRVEVAFAKGETALRCAAAQSEPQRCAEVVAIQREPVAKPFGGAERPLHAGTAATRPSQPGRP